MTVKSIPLQQKDLVAAVIVTYSGVSAALNCLKKDSLLSSSGADFYDTPDPDVKVCVRHSEKYVLVDLVLQTRKGVWHDFGNFAKDARVTSFKEKFKIGKMDNARLDKYGVFLNQDLVGVAKFLASSLS